MGEEVTEMLKGVLEGVLAIRPGRPAYGYEITAWLPDQGFSDIAEGALIPRNHPRRRPHVKPPMARVPRRSRA
ncbi:hypothetical protein ACWCSD_43750 [Nonomuraea sp. NPDC001684]